MIISFSRRFLVVHIPKTAGSTLKKALHPYIDPGKMECILGGSQRIRSDGVIATLHSLGRSALGSRADGDKLDWLPVNPREAGLFLQKHSTVTQVKRFLGPACDFARILKVAVVRNPYSRAYSAYRYSLYEASISPIRREKILINEREPTFEEFLANPDYLYSHLASRPQHLWLSNDPNTLIIRSEDLGSQMFVVLQAMGLTLHDAVEVSRLLRTERHNQHADPHEWEAMSETARDLIRTHYSADFRALAYEP